MPLGKRSTRSSRKPEDGNLHTEDPLTEYEKIRVVNMMKNNKLFQRLGLGQLKIMMTARTANNKEGCPQKSRYLYDGEDNDGSDEEVTMESQCRKGVRTHISNDGK